MLIFQWNKNSKPSKNLGVRKLQTSSSITNEFIQSYNITLYLIFVFFFLSFLLIIIIFQKSLSIVKYQIIYAV